VENNINEFVLSSEQLATLLMDVGEDALAIRVLRLVCSLLGGSGSLSSVTFEVLNVNGMPFADLPEELDLPQLVTFPDDIGVSQHKRKKSAPSELYIGDSQLLSTNKKLLDAMFKAHQYTEAAEACNALLERMLNNSKRGELLMFLALCYLQLRDAMSMEAVLMRIVAEANSAFPVGFDPPLVGYTPPPASPMSHTRNHSRQITASVSSIRLGRTTSMVITERGDSSGVKANLVVVAQSVEYMLLWARCRLLVGDPEWAIRWLKIALATCANKKQLAEVNNYLGEAYFGLCLSLQTGGVVPTEAAEEERRLADEADRRFRKACGIYKEVGDEVNREKMLNRLVSLQLKRLFIEVMVCNVSLDVALRPKGLSNLQEAEDFSRLSMEMAGNFGIPLAILGALLNCAELSLLLGKDSVAASATHEALALLKSSYLQPDSKCSGHVTDTFRKSSEIQRKGDVVLGLPGKGSCNASGCESDAPPIEGLLRAAVTFPPAQIMTVQEYIGRIIRVLFLLPNESMTSMVPIILVWNRLEVLLPDDETMNNCNKMILDHEDRSVVYSAPPHSLHSLKSPWNQGSNLRESLEKFICEDIDITGHSQMLKARSTFNVCDSFESPIAVSTTPSLLRNAIVTLAIPFEITRRSFIRLSGDDMNLSPGVTAVFNVLRDLKEALLAHTSSPNDPVVGSIRIRASYTSAILDGTMGRSSLGRSQDEPKESFSQDTSTMSSSPLGTASPFPSLTKDGGEVLKQGLSNALCSTLSRNAIKVTLLVVRICLATDYLPS